MENNISKQFENAIQLDHLTKEQLELLENILKDFK
jgi:hypothetical protein